jgi:DNA-binding response OmpR family regulator
MPTATSSTHLSHVDSVMPCALGATERSPTLPCPGVTRKVMIVEADSALRNLIAELLAFEGYFVTEAEDEEAMLRCASMAAAGDEEQRRRRRQGVVEEPGVVGEPFDLLILGLQPRGSLGFHSLARLREFGCQTPAIVLAAQPKAKVAQQIIDLDALFLGKPFELDNLRVIANHVIHARSCGFGHFA